MNEAETRTELIDPALKTAGWGIIEASRIRREVITKGRLVGDGKRATSDIADYVLVYRGEKFAVIEAKKRDLQDTEGLGQAKKYAEKLQTRFAYSTNGRGIYQVDMLTGADECHRGGANDESNWRGILDYYFAPAVQLGLTATPKRKLNADTYAYFGEPVYTYALKDGINDGYLTPFKVRQIETNLDEYTYESDDDIIEGAIDEAKNYTEKDFNRIIEIEERERHRVQLFMEASAIIPTTASESPPMMAKLANNISAHFKITKKQSPQFSPLLKNFPQALMPVISVPLS
jgi:type I site-specific restriction endonuclease